jgi:hypothetical protein
MRSPPGSLNDRNGAIPVARNAPETRKAQARVSKLEIRRDGEQRGAAVLGPDTEGLQSIPEPAIRPEGPLTTPADLVTYYRWLHKATPAQERSLAPLELDWLRTRYPGVTFGPSWA